MHICMYVLLLISDIEFKTFQRNRHTTNQILCETVYIKYEIQVTNEILY